MIKLITITSFIAGFSIFAQTDIHLDFNYKFENDQFIYGTNYTTSDGDVINFNRVQFYLSGFELVHDGGNTLLMHDSYVLASGNISDYLLSTENVANVEGIKFDLGVDYDANHLGVSAWPNKHPLEAQSPTMDWGWPSGYFFFVLNGEVDDTGDGIPNKPFELKGIGDALLTPLPFFTGLNYSETGASVVIPFDVNIADWIVGVDMPSVGYQHDAGPVNTTVAGNTVPETVFTIHSSIGIDEIEDDKSFVFADYELPYAPTVIYKLATENSVDINIYSMTGEIIINEKNQPSEGNYFIRKELETGSYIIVFSNSEIEEKFRFIVQK